jgi:hypothetical protein
MILITVALMFGAVGTATAYPIDGIEFKVSQLNSSVVIDQKSIIGWTDLGFQWAPDLEGKTFPVYEGGSQEFDFFSFTATGTGLGYADVAATLAFELPETIEIIGSGSGGWVSFSGNIVAGILHWNNLPRFFDLETGETFSVDFSDGMVIGCDAPTMITATVSHSIPDAKAVMLLGSAMLVWGILDRKRFFKQS